MLSVVAEAVRLMATCPEYAVEDVADQCGISRTHFHSVFKQYNGLTPAQYLKRLRRTCSGAQGLTCRGSA